MLFFIERLIFNFFIFNNKSIIHKEKGMISISSRLIVLLVLGKNDIYLLKYFHK